MLNWLNPFRRTRDVVIVSGLPRSGTSLMMQMLTAGGFPVLADSERPSDASNPHGYYEYAPVKRLHQGETDWLADAPGHAVKVVSPLLAYLPADYRYRVVFMERDLDEIVRSQMRMRARMGQGEPDADRLRADSLNHLTAIREWLNAQPHMTVQPVRHQEAIQRPADVAAEVNAFLGGHLDERAMTAAVDPDLYRERQGG